MPAKLPKFTDFELGWLAAAATNQKAFDCAVQTMELLHAVGVTCVTDLEDRGLEEYDKNILNTLFLNESV